MEKEFLTIDDLSQILSMKKSTLYAMTSQKKIPFYKIGHLIRFKESEIATWLESLKQSPASEMLSDRKAREIIRDRKIDIDRLIKKTIDSVTGTVLQSHTGKTRHSLGKEV